MGWLRLMNKINSFFKLSYKRKTLFIISLVLMIFIHLCLYLFSFSMVKKISNRISVPTIILDKISIEDIVWSVRTASIYTPRVTCLTQAITGQVLLLRYHYRPILKIGVINKGNFEAHAWIEIDNEIILGEFEREYVTIMEQI
jgi:hypothetical protein